MANFNKVLLIGNLTRDVELSYTPKGTAVAKFGLAINRKWKTEQGDEKEEVTFVDITCFGRTAENVGQYLHKGSPAHIDGRVKLDSWDDKQTGQKRQKLHVICESIQFLGSGQRGESEDQPQRQTRQERPARAAAPQGNDDPPPDDSDDVPF